MRTSKLQSSRQQARVRRTSILGRTALIAVLLQGCVTSQIPLLNDSLAIADSSLTGHYHYVDAQQKPADVDVFLKDKRYLIAVAGKLKYIATLRVWDTASNSAYLAQVREAGKPQYSYVLIQRTKHGADLNFLHCPTAECYVTNFHDLSNLAHVEDSDPSDHLAATKTGDL